MVVREILARPVDSGPLSGIIPSIKSEYYQSDKSIKELKNMPLENILVQNLFLKVLNQSALYCKLSNTVINRTCLCVARKYSNKPL